MSRSSSDVLASSEDGRLDRLFKSLQLLENRFNTVEEKINLHRAQMQSNIARLDREIEQSIECFMGGVEDGNEHDARERFFASAEGSKLKDRKERLRINGDISVMVLRAMAYDKCFDTILKMRKELLAKAEEEAIPVLSDKKNESSVELFKQKTALPLLFPDSSGGNIKDTCSISNIDDSKIIELCDKYRRKVFDDENRQSQLVRHVAKLDLEVRQWNSSINFWRDFLAEKHHLDSVNKANAGSGDRGRYIYQFELERFAQKEQRFLDKAKDFINREVSVLQKMVYECEFPNSSFQPRGSDALSTSETFQRS